jgi:bifunctional non-homologous end joining protein LigD
MLLNPSGPAEAEQYLKDSDWYLQEKADGVRAIVSVQATVEARSRTSKPVAISAEAAKTLQQHFAGCVLDVEVVGETVVLLDILQAGVKRPVDMRGWSCAERIRKLTLMFIVPGLGLSSAPKYVWLIQAARNEKEKRAALAILQKRGAEGVVFKLASAPYNAGRPNSGGPGLKWRFKASASVIVAGPNGTKRSVNINLIDGTAVGSVTIPPNKPIPPTGAVIEVEYLHAYRGGSLVQAVYKGVRDDVEADGPDDLQYKGEER